MEKKLRMTREQVHEQARQAVLLCAAISVLVDEAACESVSR
jgi:hypothetical protein